MAKPKKILISSSSQKQWQVSQMRKTLSNEYFITIIDDIPTCILSVPKIVSNEKPEAYAPQHVGLGPYHHFRPDLSMMHKHKLAAVKRVVINPEFFRHFEALFIDKFKLLEPVIRLSYDKYLDVDGDTLAWVVFIDGFFLLDLIATRSVENHLEGRDVIADVMMLENQLPLFVLNEILKGVNGKESTSLYNMLRVFCEVHSPLNLNEEYQFRYTTRVHLVDYMYHLIINNRGIHDPPPKLRSLNLMTKVFSEPCYSSLVDKHLPRDKILSFFKKDQKPHNEMAGVTEISSASSLCKVARVLLSPTTGGIRDIKYDEEEQILYLPVITLKKHSEAILRNLVAYEALIAKPGSCLELGEYVDLMCRIIDTAEDVTILRGKEIIKGDLRDEEIARLFNGIRKSRGKQNIKYDLGRARSTKKRVYDSWKFCKVFFTIVLLLLLAIWNF